jgi:hypothetical protein
VIIKLKKLDDPDYEISDLQPPVPVSLTKLSDNKDSNRVNATSIRHIGHTGKLKPMYDGSRGRIHTEESLPVKEYALQPGLSATTANNRKTKCRIEFVSGNLEVDNSKHKNQTPGSTKNFAISNNATSILNLNKSGSFNRISGSTCPTKKRIIDSSNSPRMFTGDIGGIRSDTELMLNKDIDTSPRNKKSILTDKLKLLTTGNIIAKTKDTIKSPFMVIKKTAKPAGPPVNVSFTHLS